MADKSVKSAGPSPIWRIVLIISLAMNLAVVGLIIGASASGRFGGNPPKSFDFGLGPVARALDRDERRAIGAALRRDRELRPVDARTQVTSLITALQTEPFDPDVVEKLIADHNARMTQIQGRALILVLDQLVEMSPEQRADFADRVEQEMFRDRPPSKRDDD